MRNTFGTLFTLTTFGESHGPCIGGVVDGMPPGIDIDMDKLAQRPYKFFERKFPFKGACDYRDEFPKEGM